MSSRHKLKGKGHDATGRSKGAEQRHVRLYEWFMESAAWQALTTAERCIYIEVERRYFGRGTNNGEIGLSVREAAARCHVSKTTATKAFRRLQELGFIECTTPGGFSRKTPHATEWRLTREACDVTGEPATKAFMHWRADGEPAKRGTKPRTPRSQIRDTKPRKVA